MPTDEARGRLAVEQTRLVESLIRHIPPPPGFDVERVRLAAERLLRKRRRALRRSWPVTGATLGERFDGLFARYVAERPSAPPGGPLGDGMAFAEWLIAHDEAPDVIRLEALRARLGVRCGTDGIRRRKGIRIAFARRASGWPMVAIGWPFGGRITLVG